MNKKKICIGAIIVLMLFDLACVSMLLTNYNKIKLAKDFEISSLETNSENEILTENNLVENEISQEIIAEETENIEIAEESKIEEIIEEPKTVENKPIQTPKANSNISTNVKTTTTTTNNAKSTVKESQTQSQTIVETPKTVQESKPAEEKKETVVEPTKPVAVETKPQVTNEEKYVRNDAMINRIKEVINNNPSEYMKNFGYEVVVDSSIKELTNQFTFTETRVKGFINFKFGTIRIYAEDYYKNGQLIMTECYII